MAELKSSAGIKFKVNLVMDEPEARALEAITKYGSENFLKHFYDNLGTTYLGQHENGLISLFESIVKEIPQHLKKIDEVRKIFIS